MKCIDCGGDVDVNKTGWAQKVEGWEVKRRSGGANQVTHPKRLNQFLCVTCVVRMKNIKTNEAQESLL